MGSKPPASDTRVPVVSPPCMYPLAGVPPSSLELAAVPLAGRNALEVCPSSSLALRLRTWMLLLTVSGSVVEVEDSFSAVPFVLASEDTLVAVLALPR